MSPNKSQTWSPGEGCLTADSAAEQEAAPARPSPWKSKPFSSKGKYFTVNHYELPGSWDPHVGWGIAASKGDKPTMCCSGSYTHSLWFVFHQGTAHTLDPLCLHPSSLPCLPCICLMCENTCVWCTNPRHVEENPLDSMFEYYFQRERAPLSWLKSERDQNSGIRLQSPGRIPGVLQPLQDLWVQISVCLGWLPGTEPLSSDLSSHLLIPFYFLIALMVRALPFHSMKSTLPSPPVTGRKGMYLMMIWWGSSWL